MSPIDRLMQNPSFIDSEAIELAEVSIASFRSVRDLVRTELDRVEGFEGAEGVVYHSLANLFWRIDEQTEGMLISFVSGCPAAAETIARTVVETSVNLMYMLRGHRAKRLTSFFRLYLKEHSNRLNEWEDYVKQEASGTAEVLGMIEGRREAVSTLKAFVEDIASGLNLPDESSSYDWSRKLFERFKATDHIASYWTVYHRLSGTTHGNAEDTLRWLLGLLHLFETDNQEPLRKLHLETIHYTAMMLCFAVRFYVNAGIHICVIYNRLLPMETFKVIRKRLDDKISQLAGDAGVPNCVPNVFKKETFRRDA